VKVRVKTTVHMPEVPAEVEVEGGSLRDLLVRLFAGVPHNRLPEGLATAIHDGDTVTLSLILIGGG